MSKSGFSVKYCVLLPIVLLITIFLWAVPNSFFGIAALTVVQQRVIALFVFAALMWITEIIPNWTTSVLVIVLSLLTVSNKGLGFLCQPEYGELIPYANIMAAFADPVVMLFLGGFVLAIVAAKYGLDVTLARALLKPFGTKPRFVLLGFLIVISVFSMFMSNTATAAMMLTFLAPVLAVLPSDDRGKIGLTLSIPFAANLGGIGTTIGTPPNATAVKFLSQAGVDVSFGQWALHMIPFVIIMILFTWLVLQFMFPFKTKKLVLEIPSNTRKKDWKTYVVWIIFVLTILLWATESITKINSNTVALIPLAVFTCTGIFGKEEIKEINWSVLWLVAGGFALGTDLQGTGLATTLINAIPFGSMSVVLVILVAGLVCYFSPADTYTHCCRNGNVRSCCCQPCQLHGCRRLPGNDNIHCNLRLSCHAFPYLHSAECHCIVNRPCADQGHGQSWYHHRCRRICTCLLLAHKDLPVRTIIFN